MWMVCLLMGLRQKKQTKTYPSSNINGFLGTYGIWRISQGPTLRLFVANWGLQAMQRLVVTGKFLKQQSDTSITSRKYRQKYDSKCTGSSSGLKIFSYLDFAGDGQDLKSTTEALITYLIQLIGWRSDRQSMVATSTA